MEREEENYGFTFELEEERERELKLKCEPRASYGTWLWHKCYYLPLEVVPFSLQFRGIVGAPYGGHVMKH